MDASEIEKWKHAGKLAAQALEYGATLVTPGAKVVDVLDAVEEKIAELGGAPAFPAQISLNHVAAHYCPAANDETVLSDQVVCLDVGVHVDGYIGDNARTIDLSGQHAKLVEASRTALNNALAVIKAGTPISEIGRTVQETLAKYDCAPVRNLSGHGLGVFIQHQAPSIPNYDTGETATIEPGMVFAVEPFASYGAGIVQEAGEPTVFMLDHKKPTRSPISRQLMQEIDTYNGLPFTTRWLTKKFGSKALFGLRELRQIGAVHEYPPLADVDKGLVSQAEHSVLIDNDGKCVILTKP